MADLKLGNKTSVFQDPLEDQPKAEDLRNLTPWSDNNGEPPITDDSTAANRGGWSVEEMFRKNQSLGVQSTFKDDLTQYTTVPAEGSKEDRARAAKIAKEIEANEKSKRMAYLENDDEERDLDKETVIPSSAAAQPTENPSPTPEQTEPLTEYQEAPTNAVAEATQSETSSEHSEAENSKFHFNPDAPSFVPRMLPQVVPIVTIAQPQYFAAQPYSQGGGYATHHIPQSLTNTLPPGYILTTQGVGMQPTFIPQPISYVPAGVQMYNQQQIVTSTPGAGGYSSFVHHAQPQTFVVRSSYDMTNGGGGAVNNGYIQANQHLPQLQYATMPLQQYHPQQFQPQQQQPLQHQAQQQQFQPQQLPYSQPPPNGLRRYGQN